MRLILGATIIAVLLITAGWWLGGPIGWILGVIGVLALGFTVWFFRDPHRVPPQNAAELVLAPADGKVIEIVEEHDDLIVRHHIAFFHTDPLYGAHESRAQFDAFARNDVTAHCENNVIARRSRLRGRSTCGNRVSLGGRSRRVGGTGAGFNFVRSSNQPGVITLAWNGVINCGAGQEDDDEKNRPK